MNHNKEPYKKQFPLHPPFKLAICRTMDKPIEIKGPATAHQETVLTPEALAFVAGLHLQFNERRLELLKERQKRQKLFNEGQRPDFLPQTAQVRQNAHWRVASIPKDLVNRKVEITGPVERKMMINAFNSGANVFMADFEDSLSPTWQNVVEGQFNLMEAVAGTLAFTSHEGKQYALESTIATLMVRPRGWHLTEKHLLIAGSPISASLFDFGLFFFHNAAKLIQKGSGPYFYLPKLESHIEARLWNDVFNFSQDLLGIPRGTIRATVLIETIPAAFEMEEILYELRDHSAGLNAGRWDYIFSIIKKFQADMQFLFPDRKEITMNVPFMRAYAGLLVATCHSRGAHAMGGMAAFIPSRKNAEVNTVALEKVREDKLRESGDGFDGTWVAHPDLVPLAQEVFTHVLGESPNQLNRLRDDLHVTATDLLNFKIEGSQITEAGMRNNITVALYYLSAWLGGLGAVAIFNLMEDAATAEISRAQLWQWLHHGNLTPEQYKQIADDEMAKIPVSLHLKEARQLLDQLVLDEKFAEFLTLKAYEKL